MHKWVMIDSCTIVINGVAFYAKTSSKSMQEFGNHLIERVSLSLLGPNEIPCSNNVCMLCWDLDGIFYLLLPCVGVGS